jgi:hypothetical protein
LSLLLGWHARRLSLSQAKFGRDVFDCRLPGGVGHWATSAIVLLHSSERVARLPDTGIGEQGSIAEAGYQADCASVSVDVLIHRRRHNARKETSGLDKMIGKTQTNLGRHRRHVGSMASMAGVASK